MKKPKARERILDTAADLFTERGYGSVGINEIIEKSKGRDVIYGTKNGGTTIQLPFGHLQFHQGGLQFHHNYEKIKELISERK